MTQPTEKYPLFRGERDESIESWKNQMMSQLKERHATNPNKQVIMIYRALRGRAQQWIDAQWKKYGSTQILVRNQDTGAITTEGAWENMDHLWNYLTERHTGAYSLRDDAEIKLHKIVQGNTRVDRYNDEFGAIEASLPPGVYADQILLYHYRRGLNPDILRQLQTNVTNDKWTLVEWKEYARRTEIQQIQAAVMRSSSKYQPLHGSRFQPTYKAEGSRGQPAVYLGEPMDIDVQARRIARHGRKAKAGDGCWECGGTDHWYQDCPKLRRGLFQGSGRRKDARRGTRGSRVK